MAGDVCAPGDRVGSPGMRPPAAALDRLALLRDTLARRDAEARIDRHLRSAGRQQKRQGPDHAETREMPRRVRPCRHENRPVPIARGHRCPTRFRRTRSNCALRRRLGQTMPEMRHDKRAFATSCSRYPVVPPTSRPVRAMFSKRGERVSPCVAFAQRLPHSAFHDAPNALGRARRKGGRVV